MVDFNSGCSIHDRLVLCSYKLDYTPFQVVRGRKPNCRHLRAFGYKFYVFKPCRICDGKVDRGSEEGVLFEYCKEDLCKFSRNNGGLNVASNDKKCHEFNGTIDVPAGEDNIR